MKHNHSNTISCSCCSPLWKFFLPEGFSSDIGNDNKAEVRLSLSETEPAQIIRVERFSTLTEKASGTIITMKERENEQVEAIGILADKIVVTGDYQTVKEHFADFKEVKERVLKGAETLIPGMIEAHMHILPTSIFNLCIDVGPFDGQYLRANYSKHLVLETLKAASSSLAEDQDKWILGRDVDPSLFSSDTSHTFDAQVLDTVSKTQPVFIMNASQHLAYINSRAIDILKEKHVRLPKDTKGILAELEETGPVISYILSTFDQKKLMEKINNAVDDTLALASQRGFTMVLDAGIEPWDQKAAFNQPQYLKNKAHQRDCPVRIAGALATFSPDDFESKIDPIYRPMQGDDKFFLPFIKVVSDGSNQGLTGYQYKTYCCNEDYQTYNEDNSYENNNHGLFNFSYPSEFQAIFDKAVTRGWPLMVHANGDQAINRTLVSFKNTGINASSIEARRDRIEHASLLSDQSFENMRDLGISPSFLIGHVGYWGWPLQQTILGENRTRLLDRCQSALEYGMRITLHSDYGVSPPGPLRMMEQSIGRIMEGAPDEAKNKVLTEEECISRFEALRAVTIDAAWQCHADHMVGSLEAGKYADFVILQQSPLTYLSTNPENKIANMRDIPVLETWKGAQCVYHWKA